MNRNKRQSPSRGFTSRGFTPPGFTIVEVLIATAMLATLFALVGEMIVFSHVAQRKMGEQVAAQQMADNLLERISGLSWASIQPGADFAKLLPVAFTDELSEVTWDVTVTEEREPMPAKRIALRVVRPTVNGRASPTVRLTAWIYAPKEVEP